MTDKDKDKDKTIKVLVTSIDGNLEHTFQSNETVGDVREFAYSRLVKDKSQVRLDDTWMEQGTDRLENTTHLSKLLGPDDRKHDKDELTLTLAWTQQGGSC